MSDNSAFIRIDADAEIAKIVMRLNKLSYEMSNSILKNSINAAARKVRKQIVIDAQGEYAIKNKSILRRKEEGAPKLFTAKPSDLTAEIKSRGPMQDIMSFMTRPNTKTGAAAAKVLNSSSLKSLEIHGIKAFVTRFASGHIAIVQRNPPNMYSKGRQRRANQYGPQADMTKIKKLLSPAVPHMLGNEEVRGKAEVLLHEILDAEIRKRIDEMNSRG